MSGSSGEKSEKATAGKLRKAREKGEIPRSKDVTMAAGLITSFITLTTFLPWYKQLIGASFTAVGMMAGRLDDSGALHQFLLTHVLILMKFILTLVPIPLSMIVASLVPGGWQFTLTKLMPDIKKLSPLAGIKRLCSPSHLTDVLKMMAKCAVLLAVLYNTIHSELTSLLSLQMLWLWQAVSRGMALYHDIMLKFVIIITLFALIDIPLSKFLFARKMRMTKQEVKEEHKNNDGNPQIKGRIRQLQRQFAIGQINLTVPEADVVITNPTHFAVALKYDATKAAAPYIVAKGVDEVALYIRQVAQKHQVEVVEFPPLARSIYHTTRVNQQIPAPLYRAIAHVLTYVMQLKSWRAGQGDKPELNTRIPIPQEVMETHGNS
ncbi:Flagellar biosynthetic protein FlhB [Paramixta manurensis]|uniref:Flagellar biosynthetic protein FlhB n=1 Tax=Paramixta manurensis TaxID=2740817 RepID=A0A6M8UFN7_9GAMM|nr:Flagellar biosynthetic protein FlhB [Erwiniaceae bacterium PD-1]